MPLSVVQLMSMLQAPGVAPAASGRAGRSTTSKAPESAFDQVFQDQVQSAEAVAPKEPVAPKTPVIKEKSGESGKSEDEAILREDEESTDLADDPDSLLMSAACVLPFVSATIPTEIEPVEAEVVSIVETPVDVRTVEQSPQPIAIDSNAVVSVPVDGEVLDEVIAPEAQPRADFEPHKPVTVIDHEAHIEQQAPVRAAGIQPEGQHQGSSPNTSSNRSDSELFAAARELPMTGLQADGTFVVSQEVSPMNAPMPTPQSVSSQIIQNMTTTISAGGQACEIDLKPEFLGRVTIALAMTDQGLTAKIRTQDDSVRAMINGQLTELKAALQEQGIKVLEMEVVYDTFEQNLGQPMDQQQNAQQHASRQPVRSVGHAQGAVSYADAAGYDFMAATLPDIGEGSVDITA